MNNQFKTTISVNKDTKINSKLRKNRVFLHKNEKKSSESDCVG